MINDGGSDKDEDSNLPNKIADNNIFKKAVSLREPAVYIDRNNEEGKLVMYFTIANGFIQMVQLMTVIS